MPSTIDITAPFDPTGYSSISGADLLDLVAGAVPYTDKGFVVLTTDVAGVPEVPNANVTTKWKRYIWLRQSAASVGIYIWDDTVPDGALLKWQAVGINTIGAGSITNAMLAAGCITDAKVTDVDYSKITNVPAPTFLPGSVTTAALANGSITPEKIYTPGGSVADLIRIAAGGSTLEFFTPKVITLLADPVGIADAGKPIVVNSAGTGYAIGAVLGQTVVQTFDYESTAAANTTDVFASSAAPVITDGAAAFDTDFTPLSAASTLYVHVQLMIGAAGANNGALAALFKDGAANAVAVAGTATVQTTQSFDVIDLYYKFAPGSTSTINFAVRFGPQYSASTIYLNQIGAGNTFGGLMKSRIHIVEYI